MVTSRGRKQASSEDQNSVPDAPMTAPPMGGMDHSFSLQILMEIQRSLGGLCSDVTALRSEIDKSTQKLDRLEEKISGITHKMYGASVVIVIVLAVGGFLINKVWDMAATHLADIAKAAIAESVRPSQENPNASTAVAPKPPSSAKDVAR